MQSLILKNIHKTFLENWTFSDVNYFTSKTKEGNNPYISLKYFSLNDDKIFINNYKKRGILRVYIYNYEPQDVLIDLDNLKELLNNKTYNNLFFEEENYSGEISRYNNEELFSMFVDFNVCLKI